MVRASPASNARITMRTKRIFLRLRFEPGLVAAIT